MNADDLKSELEQKINESQLWAQNRFSPAMSALQVRGGFRAEATPTRILRDSGRVESDGIRFQVEWIEGKYSYAAQLDVRLAPKGRPYNGRMGPYTVVYFLKEGNRKLISYGEDYPEGVDVRRFYHYWLDRVLNDESHLQKIRSLNEKTSLV